MHIIIASLMNSFDLIVKHIGQWLCTVVRFKPEGALPPEDELREQWLALGLEPAAVDVLAGDMKLHWAAAEGELQVAAAFQDRTDIWELLSDTLLGVWKFKAFVTTRWGTVGLACRSLAAGLLTGIDNLVSFIRQQGSSDFHIG
eukprot:4438857-Lingulodinium_polyedra.AAC.1